MWDSKRHRDGSLTKIGGWMAVLIFLGQGVALAETTSRYSVSPSPGDPPTQASAGDEDIALVHHGGFPSLDMGNEEATEAGGYASISDQASKMTGSTITVVTSLVVVLGLFAGFVWMTRRFGQAGPSARALPNQVFEQLGGAPIDARTRVVLLRCGSKVLVVSQTASGMTPLAELTDPDEVQAVTAACTGSSKLEFMDTLRKFESQPAAAGFAGEPNARPVTGSPRRSGRLFATA